MAKSATKIMQRARQSMARARERERQTMYMAVEKGSSLGTAVGLAMLSDKLPVKVMGIPTKLLIAGGGYVGAMFTKGNLSRALEAAADSSASIYTYLAALKVKQGESQPWVAGNNGDETGFVDEV